jgi:hypothetical protein
MWSPEPEPVLVGGGEGERRWQEGMGEYVDFDLPLEIIPYLGRVDLDSVESVLSFVRAFGKLGVAHGTLGSRGVWSGDSMDWDLALPFGEELNFRDRAALVTESLHDFREGAGAVLAASLVESELSYQDRFSFMRLRKAWPSCAPWEPPRTARSARFFLSRLMDYGLAHQVLRTTSNLDASGHFGIETTPRWSLLGRMLLEIVQAQAENLPYRRCAKCDVMFSKQSGASRFHSRADAKYCRPECARAAAQAEYRKRQRKGTR